jgi:uncharacterized protein (TIGR02271 family)
MNRDVERLQPGTDVYGSDNAKVGDVAEVGPNYLLVQKGFFFVKDRYIPFSAISRVDTDGVYLNVAKDQIDSLGWDQMPVEDTTTLTGSASTTSAATTSYTDVSTTDTTSYADVGTRQRSTATTGMGNEAKIPIIEEDLQVGKREVEGGGVRVNTRVENVPVSEQVTLREETVDVQRKPVNRDVTDADLANVQQGSFEVRERDEQAVVDKQARVVEEVHIKKNVEERVENIQDTVRRTDVDVQQVSGGTSTGGYTGSTSTSNLTGTTGTTSNEGLVEGTLGSANTTIERTTGLDTDRSGDVGDRDTRNNY